MTTAIAAYFLGNSNISILSGAIYSNSVQYFINDLYFGPSSSLELYGTMDVYPKICNIYFFKKEKYNLINFKDLPDKPVFLDLL